jgi:hypothetical protein
MLFDHGRLARWLVPKFAFFEKLIRFAYTVGLALLETVRVFRLNVKAGWLFECGRMMKGWGGAIVRRFAVRVIGDLGFHGKSFNV